MANQHSRPSPDAVTDVPFYPSFTTASTEYAHTVYRDAVTDSEVDEYISNSESFDPESSRWLLPPGSVTKEALVKSLCKIIGSIVKRFVRDPPPGTERTVTSIHGARGNEVKDEDGYSPYPDLVIRASGPSFQDPLPPNGGGSSTAAYNISFSNIASFFTVNLDSEAGTVKHTMKEMEKYAKYVKLILLRKSKLTPL